MKKNTMIVNKVKKIKNKKKDKKNLTQSHPGWHTKYMTLS
jgi:hypothetical protein